jgi:molybdate transport system substrate-binding protein
MSQIAIRCLQFFSVALAMVGSSVCTAQTFDVYAAASLKPAIDEIAADFMKQSKQTPRLSFAASSILARQIEQGAPADVFISANLGWMEYLQAFGTFTQPSKEVAMNRLVFASVSSDPLELELPDILKRLAGGRLAVPLIASVPLGLYASQALQSLGFLATLTPHLAQQDNARSSLISVSRGEVALGILYASDVFSAPGVFSVADIPGKLHDRITYQALPITPQGAKFVDYLLLPQAQAVFQKYGLLAP